VLLAEIMHFDRYPYNRNLKICVQVGHENSLKSALFENDFSVRSALWIVTLLTVNYRFFAHKILLTWPHLKLNFCKKQAGMTLVAIKRLHDFSQM